MAADYCRKSGQIPAFGDWDNANELPITQYFECARQAGLLRCSCTGECSGSYMNTAAADLYGVGPEKSLPPRVYAAPSGRSVFTLFTLSDSPKDTRGVNVSYAHSKQQRKQVKVGDQPRNHPSAQKPYKKQTTEPGHLVQRKPSISVKPVDEDLYKIPPELIENSKTKKMLGFFSKCMVPPCAA